MGVTIDYQSATTLPCSYYTFPLNLNGFVGIFLLIEVRSPYYFHSHLNSLGFLGVIISERSLSECNEANERENELTKTLNHSSPYCSYHTAVDFLSYTSTFLVGKCWFQWREVQ